jgi:hypothetical protein
MMWEFSGNGGNGKESRVVILLSSFFMFLAVLLLSRVISTEPTAASHLCVLNYYRCCTDKRVIHLPGRCFTFLVKPMKVQVENP